MLRCLSFFLTLLMAYGFESQTIFGAREIFTKPIVEMTGAEMGQLTTAVQEAWRAAAVGMTCPERAKYTIAFGLMNPDIVVSKAMIHGLAFNSVNALPAEAEIKIEALVHKVVTEYFAPVQALPEYPAMIQGIAGVSPGLSGIVQMAATAPNALIWNDVMAHVKAIVTKVAATPCDAMITEAQLGEFVEKIDAVIGMEKGLIIGAPGIAHITTTVKAIVADPSIAPVVVQEIVRKIHYLVHAIVANADHIALALPERLPIGTFIHNIVHMSRPGSLAFGATGFASPAVFGGAAPVFGSAAPVFGSPAPVFGSPAPVFGSPAPVFGSPAPVFGSPAPVFGSPAPVFGSPAPVFGSPAPVFGSPAPVFGSPAPVFGSPAPVFGSPAPVFGSPAPVFGSPAPVFGSPAPVFGSPAPVFGSPAPVFGSPAPVFGSPAPVFGSPAPVLDASAPWASVNPTVLMGAAPAFAVTSFAASAFPVPSATGIDSTFVPGVGATAFNFPSVSHPCYNQIKAVYNAALIRTLTIMRIKAIKMTVSGVNSAFGTSATFKDLITEDLVAQKSVKAVAIVKKMSWMMVRSLDVLEQEGRLTGPFIMAAINHIVGQINTGSICAVDAGIVTSAVDAAVTNFETSLAGGIPRMVAMHLGAGIPVTEKAKIMAKITPIANAWTGVVSAMKVDIAAHVVTIKPVMGLANAWGLMSAKGAGLGFDPVVANILAANALTGFEPMTTVHPTILSNIIAPIIASIEAAVPVACKKTIAARFAAGFLPSAISTKFSAVKMALAARLHHALANFGTTGMVTGSKVVTAVTEFIEREEAAILARVATIADVSAVTGMIPAEWSAAPVAAILPQIKARAMAVINKEASICVAGPDMATWDKNVLVELTAKLNTAFAPAVIHGLIADVYGQDDVLGIARVQDIVMPAIKSLVNSISLTLAPIANMDNMAVVRQWFTRQIVMHVQKGVTCCPVSGMCMPGIAGIGAIHSLNTRVACCPVTGICRPRMSTPFTGPSMAANAIFHDPIFPTIRTKYAEILAAVLAQSAGTEVGAADIAPVFDKVVNSIVATKATAFGFGGIASPVQALFSNPTFVEEFKTRFGAELVPVVNVPAAMLEVHITEAITKMLHTVGLSGAPYLY